MSADTPDAPRRPISARSETLLWAVFIAIATVTQLTFKWAGSQLRDQDFGLDFLLAAVAKPSVWAAIVGYVGMFLLWIDILKRVPLSRAYLITAVIYVPVTLGAWLIFGEDISALRGLGIAAIMMGVVLIAS